MPPRNCVTISSDRRPLTVRVSGHWRSRVAILRHRSAVALVAQYSTQEPAIETVDATHDLETAASATTAGAAQPPDRRA